MRLTELLHCCVDLTVDERQSCRPRQGSSFDICEWAGRIAADTGALHVCSGRKEIHTDLSRAARRERAAPVLQRIGLQSDVADTMFKCGGYRSKRPCLLITTNIMKTDPRFPHQQ